jgi:hypothetical protein
MHKLNYFLFCWNFEKLFITCAKIIIIIIKLNSKIYNYWIWTLDLSILEFIHMRLSHKNNKIVFIILYKPYVSKTSELKNQLPKFKIWNLINYSTVCCRCRIHLSILKYKNLEADFSDFNNRNAQFEFNLG